MFKLSERGRLYAALTLTLLAYGLLIPGLLLPFMSLQVEVKVLAFTARLLDEQRSLLSTSLQLWQSGHMLVAVLILTFSTVVPTLKAGLVVFWLATRSVTQARWCQRIINALSKWSMADVFVAAVMISFLALQAEQHVQAELMAGFYYFAGFCLLSILSSQLMPTDPQVLPWRRDEDASSTSAGQ